PHLSVRVAHVDGHHPHVRAFPAHVRAARLSASVEPPDHVAIGVEDEDRGVSAAEAAAAADAAARDDEAAGTRTRVVHGDVDARNAVGDGAGLDHEAFALAARSTAVRDDAEGVVAVSLEAEQERAISGCLRRADRSLAAAR